MGHSVFTYSICPPLLLLAPGTLSCQGFCFFPFKHLVEFVHRRDSFQEGREKNVLVQTIFTWSDMLLTPKEEARMPSLSPECSKNRVWGLPNFSPKKEQ